MAGEYGELKTAEVLKEFGDRCVVVHDVLVPGLDGANLDHVVVSGRNLLILDSKAWRNGFYHRLLGQKMRRGFEVVEHDRTDGLVRMSKMMGEATGASGCLSRLVVWPSAKAKQVYIHRSLRGHTVPVHPAYELRSLVRRFIGARRKADDKLSNKVMGMMSGE